MPGVSKRISNTVLLRILDVEKDYTQFSDGDLQNEEETRTTDKHFLGNLLQTIIPSTDHFCRILMMVY
jgi:hypothetical protein